MAKWKIMLLVLAPPGSAKATYVSTLFPVWWFAQHPQSAIIAASHCWGTRRAFPGRRVRNAILEHAAALGSMAVLTPDSMAAGVIGKPTTAVNRPPQPALWGRSRAVSADLVITDDPVKSRQEAGQLRRCKSARGKMVEG